MTASVSIVIGEAENALLVPNSALRFTPPLSSEEMKDVFGIKQIEKPIISEFDGQTGNGRNRPSEISLSGKTELIKDDSESINASDENSARIWILDESGILKLIVLVTGVTDNSYTEVVDGSLEAGQTVITGLVPGTEKRSSSNNPASMENIMRMMR
jgi:HlyD family secretion protein